MKNTVTKAAVIFGAASTLMLAAASPSTARDRWVGPAVGFAAGVAVGAAAANAGAYYNGCNPYYGCGPYAYGPGYDAYAYSPGYGYGYPNAYGPADPNYVGPWRERQLEGHD